MSSSSSLRLLRRLAAPLVVGSCALLAPARAAEPAAPAVSAAPVPTELSGDNLEMHSTDTETTAVFTGNVVLTGTNLRITCDKLVTIATRIGEKDATIGTVEKFKKILATGNVHITQGDREATCQRAEVFPRDDKVVLSEGPVIIDHSSGMVASGEPLILLRGERAVLGTNVKISAPPIGDLSATAPKPAAKPAAAAPASPTVTFPKPRAQ